MADWSAKNPYMSTISENFILNGDGSRKETRHIVFELKDSGLEYKAGDALGVVPKCPPELVESLLKSAGFTGEEVVETHLGECTLREALTDRYEIHRVSKKWLNGIAGRIQENSTRIEL